MKSRMLLVGFILIVGSLMNTPLLAAESIKLSGEVLSNGNQIGTLPAESFDGVDKKKISQSLKGGLIFQIEVSEIKNTAKFGNEPDNFIKLDIRVGSGPLPDFHTEVIGNTLTDIQLDLEAKFKEREKGDTITLKLKRL